VQLHAVLLDGTRSVLAAPRSAAPGCQLAALVEAAAGVPPGRQRLHLAEVAPPGLGERTMLALQRLLGQALAAALCLLGALRRAVDPDAPGAVTVRLQTEGGGSCDVRVGQDTTLRELREALATQHGRCLDARQLVLASPPSGKR
jgi:hypothetical protein